MEGRSAVHSSEISHGGIPEPENNPRGTGGFTLVELAIAVAIVGILATIAIPNYLRYLEKNKETTAISDINTIAAKLKEIMMENPDALPASLAQINVGNYLPLIDPWGNPYRYFPIYGHLADHSYMNGCAQGP